MSEKQNSNVIVVQDNEEKKVRRLTWPNYTNGIRNHKWWVIGATLLTGVVGLVGVQWGINLVRETLSVSYTYKLATEISSDKIERYVNGEVFDYSIVVTKQAFKDVKASDEAFANLDIDKLYNKGAIIVTRNINTDYDNEISYTLSAKSKEFPSVEIGRKFMAGLVNYPLNKSLNAIENCTVTSYIDDSFEENSYLKKTEALRKQYNAIDANYNQIKTKYGSFIAVDANGKTLAQAQGDFESKSFDIPTLLDSMYSNGFVDYKAGKEAERVSEIKSEAEANIIAYQTKVDQKDNKVTLLKSMEQATIVSTLSSESEYVKEMIALKKEIESVSDEIKTIELNLNWAGYFYNTVTRKFEFDTTDETNACYHLEHTGSQPEWVAANSDYNSKLNNSAEKLQAEVKNATNAYHYAYSLNNSVTIWGSGYVNVVNSIPWAVALVVGLALGFVVSSLITGEIEGSKKNKEEE